MYVCFGIVKWNEGWAECKIFAVSYTFEGKIGTTIYGMFEMLFKKRDNGVVCNRLRYLMKPSISWLFFLQSR
jgi:hypothetical protein